MEYISTRGKSNPLNFSKTVLEGLAPDGGLFLPQTIPNFSKKLQELAKLTYQELAVELFIGFVSPDYNKEQLKKLIATAYSSFPKEPAKLKHLKKHSILELFYGPTMSFKDYALQFLGCLFEDILKKRQTKLNILGATSGDTGSAAIYAVKGKKNITITMLFPKGMVSHVQKLQMSTIIDDNIFNLEIAATFDDCQNLIKNTFEKHNLKQKFHLGAVNSINWARILAQTTHYFYAGLQFIRDFPNQNLNFCIPTGNFGNIYAGFLAKKMGLPVVKLILATNENDILVRTIQQGDYSILAPQKTLSPAMDIQKASNFERYLYYLCKQDSEQVCLLMHQLKNKSAFQLDKKQILKMQQDFLAAAAPQPEANQTLKNYYEQEDYLMDTHTAVGVTVANKLCEERVICLATAHPAKFYDTIEPILKTKVALPPAIQKLFTKQQKVFSIANQEQQLEDFLTKNLS